MGTGVVAMEAGAGAAGVAAGGAASAEIDAAGTGTVSWCDGVAAAGPISADRGGGDSAAEVTAG